MTTPDRETKCPDLSPDIEAKIDKALSDICPECSSKNTELILNDLGNRRCTACGIIYHPRIFAANRMTPLPPNIVYETNEVPGKVSRERDVICGSSPTHVPPADVCPKCRAERTRRNDESYGIFYSCGRSVYNQDSDLIFSCRIRELEQDNAKLAAELKRVTRERDFSLSLLEKSVGWRYVELPGKMRMLMRSQSDKWTTKTACKNDSVEHESILDAIRAALDQTGDGETKGSDND